MLYADFNELVALKAYASRLSLASEHAVSSVSTGDYRSPFRGQGLEFEEVREYAWGDDIRNIDWRVTARTGRAYTKVFKEERERTVLVCVDYNANMRFGTQKTFKSIQAARVAALLAWQANGDGDRLGGCLFGDVSDGMKLFAPGRSRTSLLLMLKCLSEREVFLQPKPIELSIVLKHLNKAAPTGALIYLISDYCQFDEKFEQQLSNLRRRCRIIFVTIDDLADHTIPPVGKLLCCTYSGEKYFVNTDNKSGREAFARSWQERRDQLGSIANKLGISILSMTTKSNVEKDLALGLRWICRQPGFAA